MLAETSDNSAISPSSWRKRPIQQHSTLLQLEEKVRSYFRLIGTVLCTASHHIAVTPPSTKIALTDNASWELTAIYLPSSKSLAHPLALLRTGIKAQGLYMMLSGLILDVKEWHFCCGKTCSLFAGNTSSGRSQAIKEGGECNI